jgi:two-component sensor histidine kinase
VKNNLQIIVSLLSLQSATMKDPSSIEALTNSKARVASIALVHELLYSDRSLATIDLKAYAEELANSIGSSRGQEGKIAIRIDGQELRYDIDRAIPVGLILVELVTNAFKYAFQGRSRGIVRVSIDRDPDRDSICVEDDGVGMTTDGLDGKTLGLSLVDMLSKQLGGRIELSSSGAGTSWRLIIPSGPCRNGVPKLMGTPFRFD